MKPAPPVTRIFISNGLHKLVHLSFLLFNGLDQFELSAAAVKIMPIAVDLKIGVAREKIREEAQADLEGDELARKGQEPLFGRRQKVRRGGEVAAHEGFEHRKLHGDFG